MQVRLLGPVEVTVDGAARPVPGLRRRGVLAVLSVHAGRIVSSDRLIHAVWDDHPPATALNTLQSHVSYLRGAFGVRDAIVARSPGYVLQLGAEATDVAVAERLIRQSRQSADQAANASRLRAALALWRGPALADLVGLSWSEEHAERLTQLETEAAHALIEARVALGEHTELVPELRRLTSEQPYHENLHGQLMLTLYRAGRPADALDACRDLRRRLREDLGIDASPRLRELETAILRHDTALEPPRHVLAVAPVSRARAVPSQRRPDLSPPARAAGAAAPVGGDERTEPPAVHPWSYRAVSAETATLFRRLGLHHGPDFTQQLLWTRSSFPSGVHPDGGPSTASPVG